MLAVSHAHAELGTLQPVVELVTAARRCGAISVVDATLTAGRIGIGPDSTGAPDLLSVSFHHFGGPMGVGALVRISDLPVPPLIEGGTQERGYRPGSPNLAGCVGAGVAARRAMDDLEDRTRGLEVTCPRGPRLGDVDVDDGQLRRACDDRLLFGDLGF